MKKIASIVAMFLLVSMLGGCYQESTTLRFHGNGGVTVTSTLVAEKALYEKAGIQDVDSLVNTFSPEVIELYSAMSGAPEKGTRLEMVGIDANGNVLPEGTPLPEDGSMVGARLSMRYNSLTDAMRSFTLSNFIFATPLLQDQYGNGLKLEETRTLFGMKYSASGKINLYGNESYKAEFDAAEQELKDKVSGASASISFKFPLAFSKSNADSKGFLGQNLQWTVTQDAPEKEVYFEVTTINPLILAMGIVIVLLLIALLILLRKKRGLPDSFYVDEEGNMIPVFDGGEDTEDEAVIEEAEENSEIVDEEFAVEEIAEEETAPEDETAETEE